MIRVMVVDDHEFVRSTMCELIECADGMQVVGEAPDGSVDARHERDRRHA